MDQVSKHTTWRIGSTCTYLIKVVNECRQVSNPRPPQAHVPHLPVCLDAVILRFIFHEPRAITKLAVFEVHEEHIKRARKCTQKPHTRYNTRYTLHTVVIHLFTLVTCTSLVVTSHRTSQFDRETPESISLWGSHQITRGTLANKHFLPNKPRKHENTFSAVVGAAGMVLVV